MEESGGIRVKYTGRIGILDGHARPCSWVRSTNAPALDSDRVLHYGVKFISRAIRLISIMVSSERLNAAIHVEWYLLEYCCKSAKMGAASVRIYSAFQAIPISTSLV